MVHALRSAVVALLTALAVSASAIPAPAGAAPLPWPFAAERDVNVDFSAPRGRLNTDLVGVNVGTGSLEPGLAPLEPNIVRIDGSLETLWNCDTGTLDPTRLVHLDEQIDSALAVGTTPLVILSYMPACLAATSPFGVWATLWGTHTRPPADPAAWQRAVTAVVHELVTARLARSAPPVTWFEAWNEPDIPVFFSGTPSRFARSVLLAELRALDEVEAATGIDLHLAVCGCATPNESFMRVSMDAAADAGLDIDALSWHYYANFPFPGPDGVEALGPPELAGLVRLLGIRNPAAAPVLYRDQARRIGRRWPHMTKLITEWNLASAGFDRRNDSHAGAAFQFASLAAMHVGGVDAAAVYRSIDNATHDGFGRPLPDRYGGFGLLFRDDARKPAWFANRLWQRQGRTQVAMRGVNRGGIDPLWGIASTDGDRHTVALASFTSLPFRTPHRVRLHLAGLAPGTYELHEWRIDAAHTSADVPASASQIDVAASGRATTTVGLDTNALALLELAPVGTEPSP